MSRDGWLVAGGVALALVVGGTVYATMRAKGAQWPESPPPSAGLLRRLAEAADAFRTGDTTYVVARDVAPDYSVLGGFETRPRALDAARVAGARYRVYPTLTARDIASQEMVILPGCYKNFRTTQWICPPKDSTVGPMMARDVERIEITFVRRTGRPVRVSLPAEQVGAAIFTIDAFDRLVAPYYGRLFGHARVQRMRDSLLAYASDPLSPR